MCMTSHWFSTKRHTRPIYYKLKWIIPATLELNYWECCWVFEVFVELWPESLAFLAHITNLLLSGPIYQGERAYRTWWEAMGHQPSWIDEIFTECQHLCRNHFCQGIRGRGRVMRKIRWLYLNSIWLRSRGSLCCSFQSLELDKGHYCCSIMEICMMQCGQWPWFKGVCQLGERLGHAKRRVMKWALSLATSSL